MSPFFREDEMKQMPIEVYSEMTNAAVVRMPGRQFPGVVIQGDTLNNLCRAAVAAVDDADWRAELVDMLVGFRAHYEATLTAHGMALPYPKAGGDG
jgi:hypothetical protein